MGFVATREYFCADPGQFIGPKLAGKENVANFLAFPIDSEGEFYRDDCLRLNRSDALVDGLLCCAAGLEEPISVKS